jgi:DNA-binding MarR family transcriptional regulator
MDTGGAQAPDTVPRTLGRLRVALVDAYLRASRELGLSAQQAELLCAAMRPSAIGDLAQMLRCDRSNVSRLVDRASRRGLLERRVGDSDGRVNMVRLTDEGDALAGRFIAALERQLDDVLDQWSPQKQRSAVRLMNEIADALDAPRADPLRDTSPR